MDTNVYSRSISLFPHFFHKSLVHTLLITIITLLSNFPHWIHHKRIDFDSHSKILRKYNRHLRAGLPASLTHFLLLADLIILDRFNTFIFNGSIAYIGTKLMQYRRPISSRNLKESDIIWHPPSKDSIHESYNNLF